MGTTVVTTAESKTRKISLRSVGKTQAASQFPAPHKGAAYWLPARRAIYMASGGLSAGVGVAICVVAMALAGLIGVCNCAC